MLPLNRELAPLKFLDGFASHLRDVREPHKALRHALRDTREFFQAAHGCIATLNAGWGRRRGNRRGRVRLPCCPSHFRSAAFFTSLSRKLLLTRQLRNVCMKALSLF